ncbi:MAG: Unknown protein [uncultured Sulfurovum sp.]|uniref:Transglycosylase SLT domain-containing protein n=1 Tax=uncultured Sulfurovum sp. TaxID=269237 RepID=A0A6S6SUJ2_9BACT|nr:MAG: Unknown protein [uncultured Sulfurovum sp.]
MKKILRNILLLLVLSELLLASCSKSKVVWDYKIQNSSSIEAFFMNNYGCKNTFYKYLSTAQQIYFDTVLYPNNLEEVAYKNRWKAMLVDDKAFFKQFTFFNNYFTKHHSKVSKEEFSCFQRQKGFATAVSQNSFYRELAKRGMLHDVSYLYPLIRWAYVHNGVDMELSRERVQKAEQSFGIKKGKVGDRDQFARFIALFENEYESVAHSLAQSLNIFQIKAYKLLLVITYLESRGNIFAVSTTGAFGPTQLTLHYYMMYGEPNNPFSVKASLIKLANKFVHYHRIGKSLNASVIAYKSGSLSKCQNGLNHNDVDCRYYNDYKRYMREMSAMMSKDDISRHLTGKSYFSKGLKRLNRNQNTHDLKYYEPYQYAVLKGRTLRHRAKKSQYLNAGIFSSLGKMKRSEIYELQDQFGVQNIGVISDKKVCY